ncbi:uncharacterized protein [Periplaneta americana]|uniref:uncharacterized protein isoform X3 n=1 Tax=Periplaneta americana TaxID=6978 RepID=UPI0037E8F7B0
MEIIKMEQNVDPLTSQVSHNTGAEDLKPLLEEENLLDLHVTRIKEECVDHSYDPTSDMKFEEITIPCNFPMVKCEIEEKPYDVDTVKEEVKPEELVTDEDGIFTESFQRLTTIAVKV